ncbi:hypothetical protein GCM10022216_26150 [Sphingobacterium kyonggiense]|uniref:Uncharacterized protein n=1 Tax=Sphingobacterium kyonggiense TaxID=714075 RepID=A0ABP7YYQ3_9SPHI
MSLKKLIVHVNFQSGIIASFVSLCKNLKPVEFGKFQEAKIKDSVIIYYIEQILKIKRAY